MTRIRPAKAKKNGSQDNSVHLGKGSKIDQHSEGDCSPNVVGGSNTFNCEPSKDPPARHISAAQIVALSNLATLHPFAGKVLILYAQDSDEAYQLAKQIGDALSAGGWELQQPASPAIMSGTGAPARGVEIDYPGPEGSKPDPNTPGGSLVMALHQMFPKDFSYFPYPTQTRIVISVAANSNTKPQ